MSRSPLTGRRATMRLRDLNPVRRSRLCQEEFSRKWGEHHDWMIARLDALSPKQRAEFDRRYAESQARAIAIQDELDHMVPSYDQQLEIIYDIDIDGKPGPSGFLPLHNAANGVRFAEDELFKEFGIDQSAAPYADEPAIQFSYSPSDTRY